MSTFIWITIILAGLVWGGGALLGLWILYRKKIKHNVYSYVPLFNSNYLKCYFMLPNNRVIYEPLLINEDKQVQYKDSTYNVDESCILFEKNTPIIYFYKGIPDPINFTVSKKDINVTVDSSTYKQVLKTKLIRDLISEQRQFLIIIILCGVIALGILILILKQFGVFDQFLTGGGK